MSLRGASAIERVFRSTIVPGVLLILWLFMYLTLLLGGWVLLGASVGGWTPIVVSSGSMEPVLSVGDVLLIDEDLGDRITQRSVVVFERSDGVLVAHRVFSVEENGYVTKGDANPTPDAERVSADSVLGVGRLVVPLIGLPAVWADDGNAIALGAWVVVLASGLAHLSILGYRRIGRRDETRLEPTDVPAAHQAIHRVRFLVTMLILAQFLLDSSRFDVFGDADSRFPMLLMAVGVLSGTSLLSTRIPPSIIDRRRLSLVELGLDTALVITLTTLTGTGGIGWVLFALPVIEAAVRFRLVGALVHWIILTAITLAARIWTTKLIPTENLLGDLESVLDQLSVLFLVVVPGAYLAEQLIGDVASQEHATGRALDRSQLLERVAEAGREVTRLGERHLEAIVAGIRHLGFDFADIVVATDGAAWQQIGGDVGVLPHPGASGSGLREQDLLHESLMVDRVDTEPTEVQSLVDHDLELVLIQTASAQDGSRVVLRAGLRTGRAVTSAHLDAFRLLVGQASVALRNDQLLSEVTSIHHELEHQATHDSLTGLPNRVKMLDALTRALEDSADRPALLFLDLDGFKPVNDRLGHEVGDILLRLVARRLTSATPADGLVARVGGDEFTILLPGIQTDEQALEVADRVRDAIREPFEIGGDLVHIATSVGISFGTSGVSEVELIRQADVAMYRAKHDLERSGPVIHRSEFDEAEVRRARLVTDLPHAIFSDDLHLVYQPIFGVGDRPVMHGIEALVRWNHPDLGVVPPDEILEAARAADAHSKLNRWIVSVACRDAADWVRLAPRRPLFLAVNASPEEMGSRSLVDNVKSAVAESGLSPERLFVEISERLVSPELPQVIANMEALQVAGVRLLLDDFGEGQTSLSYLHELPIAGIKLDRKLVVNSLRSRTDRIVLESIVDLSHRLGLRVVAEGIETGEHLETIGSAGCDMAQGFHLARPQPAAVITEMLRDKHVDGVVPRPMHRERS